MNDPLPEVENERLRPSIFTLIHLVIACGISLAIIPLQDPSEGRYAEVAQNMLISGDWVTPMTTEKGDPTPFLGKPPLQFWLAAASLGVFGHTEFAARLPSLLATLGTLFVVFRFAGLYFTRSIGICAASIQLSSLIGYFFAGACMLDPLLTLSVSLSTLGLPMSLRAKELGLRRESTLWELASFLGLAGGLLTKGPVALVLTVGSLLPWLVIIRPWHALKEIRWIYGLSLTAFIAAPWYLLADSRQPGFLHYFIVHENFLRFLVKEYGDLYGSGHRHFRGMIWCMALLACLPWALVALPVLGKHLGAVRRCKEVLVETRTWKSSAPPPAVILLGLALFPLIFFTVSRQVSVYYVLPSVPALALLLAMYGEKLWEAERHLIQALCKSLRVIALVAIAGITVYACNKRFDAYIALAVALPLVMLVITSRLSAWGRRSVTSTSEFNRTAIYFVTLYLTAVLLQLTDYVGGASSRDLIASIAKKSSVNRVLFHQKLPHSAIFYSDAIIGRNKMVLQLVDDVPSSLARDEVLVIRTKNVKKNEQLLPAGATRESINEGGWTIVSQRDDSKVGEDR